MAEKKTLFELGNIKLEELDMYSLETESWFNIEFLSNGFLVGNKMLSENSIILRYYQIINKDKNVVEENYLTLQYDTKDYLIYVLTKVTKEKTTREFETVEVEKS